MSYLLKPFKSITKFKNTQLFPFKILKTKKPFVRFYSALKNQKAIDNGDAVTPTTLLKTNYTQQITLLALVIVPLLFAAPIYVSETDYYNFCIDYIATGLVEEVEVRKHYVHATLKEESPYTDGAEISIHFTN